MIVKLKDILHKRRMELGLTLKEIADRIGVTEATVQRWESGAIVNIRSNRLTMLAEILQISPTELMGWEKQLDEWDKKYGEKVSKELEELEPNIGMIARASKKMTQEQTEALRKYAQFMFPEAFDGDND